MGKQLRQALRPVFAKKWTYDDFPDEPVADDGTLLHAIERIYPFAAQSAGYYSGWVLSEQGAAMEITNLNHMLREINKIIFFEGQDAGTYHQTRMNLSRSYGLVNAVRAGMYEPRKPRFAFLPRFIREPLARVWHKIRRR